MINKSLAVCFLMFLTSCAPVQQKGVKRFFWPPVPGTEKLEYIKTILSNRDVTAGSESYLSEVIYGVERPKFIFQRPNYLVVDHNNRLIVVDSGMKKVQILDFEKKKISFLKDQKGSDDFGFASPSGIAVDDHERIWVVDNSLRKMLIFDNDGRNIAESKLKVGGRLSGLVWDSVSQQFYLVATEEHRVVVFDHEGREVASFGRRGGDPGEFNFPTDIAVDEKGNIYVLDSLNARVQVFDSNRTFIREFGERGTAVGSFQIPKGIAISPQGYVFVTDGLANKVVIFSSQGDFLMSFGGKYSIAGGSLSPGGFNMPQGIYIDARSTVWVADTLNQSIQRFQILTEQYLRDHPILPGQHAQAIMPHQ